MSAEYWGTTHRGRPRLTARRAVRSVRQPAVTMGALAAELLLEETEAQATPGAHEHRRVVLQPELVVRRSSLAGR